jgi:hypothetical protein
VLKEFPYFLGGLQVASFELLDSLREEAVTVPASQLGSGQVAASIGGMQAMASLA